MKDKNYISKIIFNNNESIDINKDDIVIFVGPNNAGKSQALKDIYMLSSKKQPSIVISDIEITKVQSSITEILNSLSDCKDEGNIKRYYCMGNNFNIQKESDQWYMQDKYYGNYRDLFIANLNTINRLSICEPPNNICRNDFKNHPIHYAAFNPPYRKWLTDNFKKAFGKEITPNILYGAKIPLCIGDIVSFDNNKYENEQERQEAYAQILSSYKQVQNQGDGVKSFTGILLYLMLDYYSTYLIDEPESFLHPPQAKIMGNIIGQSLKESNQQAFISTHSEEIIKGLMEACPDRIKIIRITRSENVNSFSILNNEEFMNVWNDPLLKYSNIMSSLFYKSVILCESDSDCKMYSIILSYLKQLKGQYLETLFIHCGGKQRMYKIAKALISLGIKTKIITDIDILDNETNLKNLIDVFNIEWSSLEKSYNILLSNLSNPKEKIERDIAKTNINNILNDSTEKYLSNKNILDIKAAIEIVSKWKYIKNAGKTAIPAGDATSTYNDINSQLKDVGIYIVPVGELENFVKEIGGHGPEWVNKVLETYPQLDNSIYNDIKQFMEEIEV